ncbi:hypothetical protein JCM10213_003189 [Rhodosporidiobolus nylandii]
MSLPSPPARLRRFPSSSPSLNAPCWPLVPTFVPAGASPRSRALSSSSPPPPPPVIAVSAFLPLDFSEHLFREKADSAITTKYLPGRAITNGEAALHSFATALVRVVQCADYAWQGGHSQVELGTTPDGRYRLGRRAVLSTSLHCDFEDDQVAEAFFALPSFEPLLGRDLGTWRIPTPEEKKNGVLRARYDRELKQHAVWHLLPSRSLPCVSAPPQPAWTVPEAISHLRHFLSRPSPTRRPSDFLSSASVRLPSHPYTVLSLPFLLVTHIHLLANELSALESLTGGGGYLYTHDPPSIFARRLPAELSTLLVFLALRELVLAGSDLRNMRCFALNAFTPELASLFPLLPSVLPAHVVPLTRTQLFSGPSCTLASPAQLRALGLKGDETLVLHNNSDAFGQNVESERAGGSVDGVLGEWGDAAAALRRDRRDLMNFVA